MGDLSNKIQKNWIVKKLADIAEWGSGGTPKSDVKEYYNGNIPWLVIGDLNDGKISTSQNTITELGLKNSSAKIVPPNNVLIAMYGSIGKLGINTVSLATNQAIAFTKKIYPFVYNKYLFYYLFHIRTELHKLGKGGTQKNISQSVLKEVNILLPPLAEQNRIVAKIEELFSELDQGIESLKKAQEQLKIYRQAVLKQAFEGKLTEKWRQQQLKEGNLESAESLLLKIKQERERLYQQQLDEWERSTKEWEASGKQGKKPAKPKKNYDFDDIVVDSEYFVKIPEGWKLVKLGDLLVFGPKNGYSPEPVKYQTQTKSLTLTATTSGQFLAQHFKYIDEKIEPTSFLWLKDGDILIQRANTIEYVGISAIYRGKPNIFIYPDLMMKIVCSKKIKTEYIYYSINMHNSKNYFKKRATGTAGSMPKINKQIVNNLPILLAPYQEQIYITEIIQQKFLICEQLENEIMLNLQRAKPCANQF